MFPRNPFSCRRSVLRPNSRLGVAGVVALFLFFMAAHMAFTALVPLSWREADLSHVVRVIAERQNFPVDQIDAETKRDIMRKLFGASYESNESLPSAFAKNLSDALNRYPTPSPNKYYPEYFKKLATLKSEAVTEKSLLSVANKLESFRPILSWKEKADLLHAFDAFALACETAGLTYFLLEASLMGVRRHHGMIPWDDDIDIVVNASQWTELYTVLSDIPGFELFASKDAQWKFYVSSAKQFKEKPFKFPYLDIFFFSEDDQYIWAVTQGLKHDLVHRKWDIFPLLRRPFEGRQVPVPCNLPLLVDNSHDVNECITGEYNHKTNERFYYGGKISTPCTFLTDVYPLVERKADSGRPGYEKEVLRLGSQVKHTMTFPTSCR